MSPLLFQAGSLATVLAFVFHMVQSQLNPAFTQNPASSATGTNTYYFDSASDCNRPIRELYASKATIKGKDPSSTKPGQTTCTIRLQSTGQFESMFLDIEVISMNIQDCDIQISIYDGDGAQQLMMSYDCRSSQNQNRKRFITSGNTVTFMMARRNINSANFDVEITVSPIRGGINPSDQNVGIASFDKFPQTAIVGMIGAFYAIVIIICTLIIVYFRRNYWGMNKQWETHQLATMQTDQMFQKRLMSGGRGEANSRYVSSNASTVDSGEDQGKINAHRVKARNGQKQTPCYSDASDTTSDYSSSNDESDVTSTNSSVKKQSFISEDRTSRLLKSDTNSDTETRTDSVSENDSSHHVHRTKNKKDKVQHKIKQRKHKVNSFSEPNPSHSQSLQFQAQHVPYNAYPTGHFVPLMTAVPHFQSPPVFSTLPPPTYTEIPARQQVHATEPPVYSYLVRRGYTPIDATSSSVGHTLHVQKPVVKKLEEPELMLDSGVEYMRR
ncbi:hypothetical protein BsWGS_11712 [Bradybaena similaris]